MFSLLFLIIAFIAGLYIGWHFPQPAWAVKITQRVRDWNALRKSRW